MRNILSENLANRSKREGEHFRRTLWTRKRSGDCWRCTGARRTLFRSKSAFNLLFTSSTLSEWSVKGLKLIPVKGKCIRLSVSENKLPFPAQIISARLYFTAEATFLFYFPGFSRIANELLSAAMQIKDECYRDRKIFNCHGDAAETDVCHA